MVGITITFFSALGIATIPLVNLLSRRIGKHRCLAVCLGLMMVASVLKYFLYRPDAPYLQLGVFVFQAPGQAAYYVLLSSMLADFVDHDELKTGTRRAALIMSASGWVAKVGTAVAFLASGLVLSLAGFEAERGAEQAPGVIFSLRVAYALVPLLGSFLALCLLRGYPLSQAKMAEVQQGLAAAAAAKLRLQTPAS
jgi:GPH family glycoside/pentoside/hexuronide:cation symporter